MGLPRLTHLQFAVLRVIGDGRVHGVYIHERLERVDISYKLGSFKAIMTNMERAGLVESELVRGRRPGLNYQEKLYWATDSGKQDVERSREFYG